MENSLQTDVLIVGGGPAGLMAAATAAASGVSTLLIESEDQIGSPVHTSGATAIRTMRDFDIPARYYHPIHNWRFCSPRDSVNFNQTQPWGCIIDVQGMYQFLAERARDRGAVILTGTRALRPILSGTRVIGCHARGKDGREITISSQILIDAGGYKAELSQKAGLHTGFRRFGVGAEFELIAPHCRQDEAVLVMGSRYAPCGYAWAFPWGEERLRLGVGILHTDSLADPRRYLDKFLAEAATFNLDLTGHSIVERHFGLVPAESLPPNLVDNGILAVGDAAGQASLIAGEGIRLSLQAGRLAAETAVAAIKKGRFDRPDLVSYQNVFNSRYRRNLKLGYLLNKSLANWNDRRWDEGVRLLKSVPDGLLTQLLQSEFSSLDLAFWLASRPRLWPKVVKYGLKMLAK